MLASHRDSVQFLKQGHRLFHNPLDRWTLLLCAHVRPTVQGPPMEVDDVPVAQAPVVTPSAVKPAGQRAEDILAMIRSRQNK